MKYIVNTLLGVVLIGGMSKLNAAVEVSAFCRSHVPGTCIIEAQKGYWNWGMAPIYDGKGKLHVFNSVIPKKGSWVKHSKIAHYTADKPEGPYTFVEDTFSSDEASYHNPQVSKVGDIYVLVFLLNRYRDENGSRQEVGIATTRSLDGPWTESPHNPIIRASGTMRGANIVHASNPSFVAAPDGTYRIYYKSMTDRYRRRQAIREISLAVSNTIEGPYENCAQNPLISYMDHKLDIEDPYAFYYKGMYYMIVEDRQGVKNMLEGNPIPADRIRKGGYRPGLIYKSKDGIDWGIPEVGYQTNKVYFGAKLARSERPHILWKDGKPECLFLACHDHTRSAGYFLRIENWEGD